MLFDTKNDGRLLNEQPEINPSSQAPESSRRHYEKAIGFDRSSKRA